MIKLKFARYAIEHFPYDEREVMATVEDFLLTIWLSFDGAYIQPSFSPGNELLEWNALRRIYFFKRIWDELGTWLLKPLVDNFLEAK